MPEVKYKQEISLSMPPKSTPSYPVFKAFEAVAPPHFFSLISLSIPPVGFSPVPEGAPLAASGFCTHSLHHPPCPSSLYARKSPYSLMCKSHLTLFPLKLNPHNFCSGSNFDFLPDPRSTASSLASQTSSLTPSSLSWLKSAPTLP